MLKVLALTQTRQHNYTERWCDTNQQRPEGVGVKGSVSREEVGSS